MKGLRRVLAGCALAFTAIAHAQDASSVFERASPSVVTVKVYDAAGTPEGQGSGVVVGADEVVTNCHVIEGARRIEVVTHDGRELKSIPTRGDLKADVCLLRVENLSNPAAPLRAGSQVKRGERVFAVGNPLRLGVAVSEGVASALITAEGEPPRILATAAVSPGSSGGGLFDAQGHLIGITTYVLPGQNVNVAMPAELIAKVRREGEIITPPPPPEKEIEWFAVAQKLASNTQWQALAEHATRWLDAYPSSLDAAHFLGRAQLYSGKLEQARDTFLALSKRFPRASRVYSFLAQAHRAWGNLDFAEAAALTAVALTPGDAVAHAALAEVYTARHKYDEARKSADTAVRIAPSLDFSLQKRANIALEQKRYADAASDMRVIVRLYPSNTMAKRTLAEALALAGEPGEARTVMTNIGTPDPMDASVWSNIGHAEIQLRRYADAEQALRRAIAVDSRFGPAWSNLAQVLRDTNRHQEAQEALRTVEEISAEVAALLRKNWRDMVEAKRLRQQATPASTRTVEAGGRGHARMRQRDYRGAVEVFAKIVERDPGSIDSWLDLAQAYAALREDAQAVAAMERAEKLDPFNARLMHMRARFHGDRGDLAKALELAEQAVQKHPADAQGWHVKGLVLIKLAQFKPAVESFNTAVRLDLYKVESWGHLGEAHWRAGELGEAKAALERALYLLPKSIDARLLMARVLADSGQLAVARKYADEVIQEEPNLARAWTTWGIVRAASDDDAATLRAYEKLKGLNPQLAVSFRKNVEARVDPSRLKFPD
jgi:tetratricopeptide (TPR) repeat protein